MTVLLTFDCVALAIAAGFGAAVVIPACNTSLYQYRLTQLRDQVADDVLDGRIENAEWGYSFIHGIDQVIKAAPGMTLPRTLLINWTCRKMPRKDAFQIASLSDADKHIADGYIKALMGHSTRRLLFGSPAGWLITVFVGGLAFLVVLPSVRPEKRRGLRGTLSVLWRSARGRVAAEVDPTRVAAASYSGHTPRHALSNLV